MLAPDNHLQHFAQLPRQTEIPADQMLPPAYSSALLFSHSQDTTVADYHIPPVGDPAHLSQPSLHRIQSDLAWRAHRHTSVDSRSSSQSGTGTVDGWSTVDPGLSNSDTSDSDGLDSALRSMAFRQSHGCTVGPALGQGAMSDGYSTADPGRRSSRIASKPPVALSIDPNLFRPKHEAHTALPVATAKTAKQPLYARAVLRTGECGRDGDEDEDEDEPMYTAKPKKRGGAASGKGKAGSKGKKISHARKHNAEHIPRPRNAFILFRKHIVDAKLIPASVEIRHQNVSVIVAKMWADAPAEQKAQFNELARVEKEEHMKKYPGYRYQPVYRRTNVIRRRVRKDEAEEEKCDTVAALLLKGTSGEKLEAEIKVKMREPDLHVKASQKSNGANELSKGALRALKAQARLETGSTTSKSRASSRRQSLSSRAESVETDSEWQYDDMSSRRSSIVPDLHLGQPQFGYGTYNFQPGQLAPATYNTMYSGGIHGAGLPSLYAGMPPGQGWVGQSGMQQTWAYPEQESSMPTGMPQMTTMAYQQPAHMDPFFNYDQALPFSPTAHAFDQSFAMPGGVADLAYPLDEGNHAPPMGYNYMLHSQAHLQPRLGVEQAQDSSYPPVPESAKWDVAFRPGVEGLPFDDNGILGDFGAALMQAEEMGGW